MKPGPATEGDTYSEYSDPELPLNLTEAINATEADGFMRKVLGDSRYEMLIEQARREIAFVENQITDVERERYMGNL